MKNYLNFETEIKDLENELEKLKDPYNQEGLSEVDTQKISNTQIEIDKKLKNIYSNLDPWQTTMVARHEDRPKSKFFIDNLFEDFISLSGDRYYGEDKSVLTGFAKFNGKSVLVIGQEKGEDLDGRIERNFGMMRPEGYRKTIRLMNLANKFNIPIISFIDTPGAYPGVGAEERGQAETVLASRGGTTKAPSEVYGAEHLLRLFVKLPELLPLGDMDAAAGRALQVKLTEFLRWLQRNAASSFGGAYVERDAKEQRNGGKGEKMMGEKQKASDRAPAPAPLAV